MIKITNPTWPNGEEWVDDFGLRLVGVHPENEGCRELGCAVHNPSDHHMRDFPLRWSRAREIFERVCPHDAVHPDPDEVAYRERNSLEVPEHFCCRERCCEQ